MEGLIHCGKILGEVEIFGFGVSSVVGVVKTHGENGK